MWMQKRTPATLFLNGKPTEDNQRRKDNKTDAGNEEIKHPLQVLAIKR